MNNTKISLCVILLLASFCLQAEPWKEVLSLPKETHDGRLNTSCPRDTKNVSLKACTPSFYRVLAAPEQYHGKIITLTGFLIREFDRYFLFPNKQSYENGQDVDSIEITGIVESKEEGTFITYVPEVPEKIKSQVDKDGLSAVLVSGIFDARYVGNSAPRAGVIRSTWIMYTPRIKG